MGQLLALLARATLVAATCYLISQGNLTAAAIIIGAYWIILELIQLQLINVIVMTGMSFSILYRRMSRR